MKRITILLAVLALLVAGCASQGGASAEAGDATPSPTPEATESPSADATASDNADASADSDGSSGGGDLTGLLPDEVGGLSRTDIPGMESMIANALAGSGVEASGAEYAFASYGDGTRALIVTALRIPGVPETSLQMLARAMAGVDSTGADVDTVTVGGKSVLQLSGESAPAAAYIYFAADAVFTVIGEDPDLAAELLADLP